MVTFIFGSSGSGKTYEVFNEISTLLATTDRKICLIVPEQHTVNIESAAARYFGTTSSLKLEVTNFTRLSDSVARRVGHLSYVKESRGSDMLFLHRALMSVFPSLTELSKVSGTDAAGLLPLLYSATKELKLSSVSPEELLSAADEIESIDGECSLSASARDIAIVYSAFASLKKDYGAVEDTLERLREGIAKCNYFDETDVFIDSFYSLTGAQYKILSEIIRNADNVTLTFPLRSQKDNGVHLDGVRDYYEKALAASLRYSEKPQIVTLTKNHRAENSAMEATEKYLWRYTESPSEKERADIAESRALSVVEVADRHEEAEALCAKIASLVRNGAKYSDIAVVASNIDNLRTITDSAMIRHNIPVFVSDPVRISASPAVRLILSLLKIPAKWQRQDIIAMVKTGLCNLDDAEACAFESYTEIWNIRSAGMFLSEWNMNPDGYREELSDRGKLMLRNANSAREKLCIHIERFCDVFKMGKASVREICAGIVSFFELSGAYRRMMDRAKTLSGDEGEKEKLVWREICNAFDTMVEILGDVDLDSVSFAALFRHVISDADTGAIPTGMDNVIFASASNLRAENLSHVIMLGCIDGEFPSAVQSDGYFSDRDRERLGEVGLVIGSDSSRRISEEMFRFYKAASAPSKTLTLFVPKSSSGSAASPSNGAMEILGILGQDKPTPYSELAIEDKIFDNKSLKKHSSRSEGAAKLYRELYGEESKRREIFSEDAKLSGESARALFGNSMRLTQSRIDSFVKCPLSYYCRYVLKLSEESPAEIAAVDIGNFVHGVLEEFFTLTSKDEYPLAKEECAKICREITKAYVDRVCGGISDGRMEYLFIRLLRHVTVFVEAIMEEMAQSRFTIYKTELPIGGAAGENRADVPSPVVFPCADGGTVSLYGVLDRLDVYEEGSKRYVRVVDYKTGSKKFSYDDVMLGLNVQLLLYLFSAWRSGEGFAKALGGDEILPAGALYLMVKPGDISSDVPLSREEAFELAVKNVQRSGVVTDDLKVLDAMDSGISGKYIPVTLKQDGTFKSTSSVASLERFGEMYREMGETISKIAAEMKSGKAAAAPLKHGGTLPCDYCAMSQICRHREK